MFVFVYGVWMIILKLLIDQSHIHNGSRYIYIILKWKKKNFCRSGWRGCCVANVFDVCVCLCVCVPNGSHPIIVMCFFLRCICGGTSTCEHIINVLESRQWRRHCNIAISTATMTNRIKEIVEKERIKKIVIQHLTTTNNNNNQYIIYKQVILSCSKRERERVKVPLVCVH